jgi:hypothetical protein
MATTAENLRATPETLRAELGPLLIPADRVRPYAGVATGWAAFDEFVIWQGLPKGALTLFSGSPGFGATTLWAQAAARVTAATDGGGANRWAAWVSGPEARLCPWALKKTGVDFRRLLVVGAPKDEEQLVWALREILTLSLFDLVGCDLGGLRLSASHLVKIKRLVEQARCALVLLSSRPLPFSSSSFAVALEFRASGVRLSRALHRPTPLVLPRRDTYADLMPELAQVRAAGRGRNLPDV